MSSQNRGKAAIRIVTFILLIQAPLVIANLVNAYVKKNVTEMVLIVDAVNARAIAQLLADALELEGKLRESLLLRHQFAALDDVRKENARQTQELEKWRADTRAAEKEFMIAGWWSFCYGVVTWIMLLATFSVEVQNGINAGWAWASREPRNSNPK